MLQKIVPKTIAMRAYLVTTVVVTILMGVIGYMYADATRQHIWLSQERKLMEIVAILAQRLNSDGLMMRYEEAANATDEAKLQAIRASLQSIVEEVGQQYPGFAMGYSLRDSRLAVFPYRPEIITLPMTLHAEESYREKRALFLSSNFKSIILNEMAIRITYPILKNENRLGHVWSIISLTRVNSAVYQAWFEIVFILLVAWTFLMVVLNKVFTDISKTLAEVADKITRQDDNIDTQKVPQLQSVLMAIKDLRNNLQDKETAYRTLVENSPDMITRRDTMGQMVYTNPELTKNINLNHYYSIGDMVVSRNELLLYKDELSRNVATTGTSVEFEYKRHLNCGGTRYLKCTVVPERDETGQVISVLAVSRDITDIKEAGELFMAAFNLSPNIMTLTRQKDHTIIQVNNTFVKTTGLSSDTVVGRTTAELGLWLETDNYNATYILLMQQGCLNTHEVQFTMRGRVLTALLSSRQITINEEPCWLHVVTDITEKKQLDAEMARLSALNLVGEMAAGIGHEVRNPMTTVRGYLQLFQRKAEFLPYNERLVTMIEEIDRANAIITEFLTLAKNKKSNLEQGNLNTVVQTLFPLMQADALLMGQQLEVSSLPRTPFDGQYKQMVNCTLREVLRKCQNTVQNLKWKQLNV